VARLQRRGGGRQENRLQVVEKTLAQRRRPNVLVIACYKPASLGFVQ
jgi:hypothetical protein